MTIPSGTQEGLVNNSERKWGNQAVFRPYKGEIPANIGQANRFSGREVILIQDANPTKKRTGQAPNLDIKKGKRGRINPDC